MERYQQQIKLKGFGIKKQQALEASSVLVIGAGGLGCAALQTLAAIGVGTLGIADNDRRVRKQPSSPTTLYTTRYWSKKKLKLRSKDCKLKTP